MTLETIFTAAADWMRDQDSKAAANSTIGWVKEEWDKVNWAEASARYAQRLEEQHNRFKPLGRSEPIPLGDIFTDVYLLNKISARQWYSLDELKEQFSDRLERRRDPGKRRNGLEVARQRPHLYILGKPGAGKTTFLRYLTVQALRGGLDGAPIFVSLHAWSKSNLGLLEFIDQEFDGCGFPRARPFVDYILQTGRALALFDGLDEVRHDKQDELITALNDFSRRYPTSRMVITCRLAADRYTFENFSDVELADFGPKQIKTFVCHWFRNEPDTAQKFLDELARPDNAGVRELAAVPILLNLLCLAFGDAYHLPSRRSELYGRAIHTLLKYWDDSRNIKRAETEAYELYRNLSADQKKHLIAYIAATTLPGEDYFWPRDRLESGIAQIVSRIAGVGSPIDGGAILSISHFTNILLPTIIQRQNLWLITWTRC
jgi:predicted NACHT family NTPase